jgi:hypothetical protein
MTAIDVTGGLDPAKDGVVVHQPEGQPGAGENHAFWFHNEASGLQVNGHLNTSENIGDYEQRLCKLSVTFPDGRILLLREIGNHSDERTTSSGSLRYHQVEPFRRWSGHFVGAMDDVTVERNYLTGKTLNQIPVAVRFDIDTEMVAPPYVQGSMVEGGMGVATPFFGGERYEQLFHGVGTIRIGGTDFPVDGYGLRTHRWGTRDLLGGGSAPRMLGHVWGACAFPDGTGFHAYAFPTADGGVLWSEGLVVRDGTLVPARIVKSPWLSSYRREGERLEYVFETEDGQVHEISGEVLSSSISLMVPAPTREEEVVLSQSSVRYTMGDQTAVNMLERSLRRSAIETGIGRPGG